MTKGIEIKDLTVGTGDEATKGSIVVANVREFLRRGDEVSRAPLFGTRRVIDLTRRESIAGLRYGIRGMRVGGTREIVISPHLAYGEAGIPGRIPPNALLRCEVELVEIREHSALLPQDWLPGKVLMLRPSENANERQPGWSLTVHQDGNSRLTVLHKVLNKQQGQTPVKQFPIALAPEESTRLIRLAMDLPKQIPDDCVGWNSGFIDQQKRGLIIKDRRDGARCMVIHVQEGGGDVCLMGVHEASPEFLNSAFHRTIEQLIRPYLSEHPVQSN